MSIEGELLFRLGQRDGRPHCELRSSRPQAVARLFDGKPLDTVLTTLPLLFNVCARAQSAALVAAIESALRIEVSEPVAMMRQAVVTLETLREQSLRVLRDWPAALGESPDQRSVVMLVQGVNRLIDAMRPAELFRVGVAPPDTQADALVRWDEMIIPLCDAMCGELADDWLETSATSPVALQRWVDAGRTLPARFLRWLADQRWCHAGAVGMNIGVSMDDARLWQRIRAEGEAFTAQPDDDGEPRELSWYCRIADHPLLSDPQFGLEVQHGRGIYVRSVARLLLIAKLIRALEDYFQSGAIEVPAPAEVPGMAHVEAARGRLTHCVELVGDRVQRLRILAPTEWNFHPQGIAARSVETLPLVEDWRIPAKLLIHAIDPCVGFRIEAAGNA